MNPHQQNKVDINSLSPEEQRLLRLYGKMPTKKDVLQNKLKERKYFDSGDYALSKAGKASDVGVTNVGSRHPLPENIPHLTATSPNAGNGSISAQGGQQIPGSISSHPGSIGFQSRSPVKDNFLHRNSTLSSDDNEKGDNEKEEEDLSVSPPPAREGVPIQR
ncbi:Endosulphine [Penicillium soppii]|uniref:Endosulphine n=1 Tax=Penicillium soppii TaxID=69789 RepID=UPI00254944EA|nr:Endosulphine [Penicillium soppii]KAJ5855756.1 Endosulphine [Penicillium soppii]